MKKIHPILLIIFLLISTSCEYNKDLNGKWAILEMYYDEQEISGNTVVYAAPTLTFKGRKIHIDFHGNKPNLFGKRLYNKRKGEEIITISELEDNRFNREYTMYLELVKGTRTSKNRRYEMILESDSVYIRAIKSVVIF